MSVTLTPNRQDVQPNGQLVRLICEERAGALVYSVLVGEAAGATEASYVPWRAPALEKPTRAEADAAFEALRKP